MKSLAVAALLSATVAMAAQQTHTILFKPEKGHKAVYKLSFAIVSQGPQVVYEAKLTNEVVEVRADGSYITASYQTEGVTIVDGKKEPSLAETITAVTTYDKFGKPLSIGGDEATPDSFRVANLTSFIAPTKAVAVGESWTARIAADAEKKTRAVTHTYKLLSVEGGTAVVEMNAAEAGEEYPASARGRVTLDLETGEQTKFDLNVKNMPIGQVYVDGRVVITKQAAASAGA
jgi:hypothetical protein